MARTPSTLSPISSWPFLPSAKTPVTSSSAWRKFPRSSAASIRPAAAPPLALYAQVVSRVVPVSSTRAAEMAKLLENIFRCVNIALVNELKLLALRMGIDIWEVIDAAATKPFGFMPFYPGPGLGGHCIPVDPYYLSWKAREYDFATRFIELAGEVNTAMPYHVVDAIAGGAERPAEGPEGLAGIGAGRGLQERRGRPARIPHAEDHAASPGSRGAASSTTIPTFPELHKMRHYDYAGHALGRIDAGAT